MLPTARTLAALRKQGCMAGVVERWNPHARVRQDFLGFVDIIALRGTSIVGIQATSGDHVAHRIAKIRDERRNQALAWLTCGGVIEVWGWRRLKVKRGGKAVRWQVDIRSVTTDSLVTLHVGK